jgi:hypothetical protein
VANPQAYPASDILEAIRVRIVAATGVDDAYVRLVNNDSYQYSNEETLIAIRPLGPVPVTDAGGGRYSRPVSRTIRIYLHKRSSIDFVGDDRYIVGEICDLEDIIYNACDDWFPYDSDDELNMTIEPLHPVDSTSGPPTRQSTNDIGENFSRIDFTFVYVQPNDQEVPE